MHRIATYLLISCLPQLALAEEKKKKRGAMDMLTPGSVLQNLRVPNYDANQRLSSVTAIANLTILGEKQAIGQDIDLSLYDQSGNRRTRLLLDSAEFDADTSYLTSRAPVTLTDPGGHLTATGLYINMQTKQTYLLGPCRNHLYLDQLKSAQVHTTPHRTPHLYMPTFPFQATPTSIVANSLTLLSSIATAAIPGALTPSELTRIEETIGTDLAPFTQQITQMQTAIEQHEKASAQIDERLKLFRDTLSIPVQNKAAAPPLAETDPEKKPDIEATCVDGIYVDPETDAIVYVKDVVFKYHPKGMVLTAKGEVKALLNRKPAGEKKEKKEKKEDPSAEEKADEKKDEVFNQFQGLKSVTASGGIDLTIKLSDGTTARATGDTLFYDHAKQEAVIKGGTPTFKGKGFSMKAKQADQYIIIPKDGKIVAPGQWHQKATELKKP